jgi:hypothetical protein
MSARREKTGTGAKSNQPMSEKQGSPCRGVRLPLLKCDDPLLPLNEDMQVKGLGLLLALRLIGWSVIIFILLFFNV